jgi:hypothetical protein
LPSCSKSGGFGGGGRSSRYSARIARNFFSAIHPRRRDSLARRRDGHSESRCTPERLRPGGGARTRSGVADFGELEPGPWRWCPSPESVISVSSAV